MYIESEEINGKLEAVLYADKDKSGVVIPRVKNDKGEESISVPKEILNYIEDEQKGWVDKEARKEVDRLVNNLLMFGDWRPDKDSWIKSFEEIIEGSDYLKKYIWTEYK